METFKGTGIDYLRKAMQDKGSEAEAQLLARLDPTQTEIYKHAMPITWIDVNHATTVYAECAKLLYPGAAEPLVDLGRDMARNDLTGIYKVLLRVTTIPMVINRTAKLWSNYHKRGAATVEREGDAKKADLVVSDYPDLPQGIRTNVIGYVQGVIDLTGSKNPRVEHDPSTPEAWRWHITWE